MSGAYGPRMLEHARNPRNRGQLHAPSASQDGTNMSCGDRIRIELDIDGDVITNARFTAKACSICVASASALTELVRGARARGLRAANGDEMLVAQAAIAFERWTGIGGMETTMRAAIQPLLDDPLTQA